MKMEVGNNMICSWLKENYIRINIKAKNSIEAIQLAAQPLVDDQKITSNYVNEIIDNLNQSGPYFVLMPHIALPHAQTKTDAVISNAIGITVLDKPVVFNSKANDPVKILITLAAKKSSDHLQVLSELSSLLDNQKFIELLQNAHNSKEIMDLIRKEENKCLVD